MTSSAKTAAMQELEVKREAKKAEEARLAAVAELDIPKPVGYKILIALPTIEEAFESGILKTDSTIRDEYILSTIGLVLDMGKEAYMDKAKFPDGPWCEVGDYVLFRANTGTRFKIGNQEMRLFNDDSIEAVVPNPKAIKRAG